MLLKVVLDRTGIVIGFIIDAFDFKQVFVPWHVIKDVHSLEQLIQTAYVRRNGSYYY